MEKIVPLWPIGYKVCAVFEGIVELRVFFSQRRRNGEES